MIGAPKERLEPCDLEGRTRCSGREKAGAADDGARKPLAVVRDIGAHLKAAHAVAKDNVGGSRSHALLRHVAKDVYVLHECPGPASNGQLAPVLGRAGAAVANLVMPHDEKPVGSEEAGKGVVAVDVLGHAMDELHDPAG